MCLALAHGQGRQCKWAKEDDKVIGAIHGGGLVAYRRQGVAYLDGLSLVRPLALGLPLLL